MGITPRAESANPFERLTLAQLRDRLAGEWIGTPYANLDPAQQTALNYVFDEGYDRISDECFGGQVWLRRIKKAISLSAAIADYNIATDIKRIITVRELVAGKYTVIPFVDRDVFDDLWGTGTDAASHPLVIGGQIWHSFLGYSDDDPPQWILTRHPTPVTDDLPRTWEVNYRPNMEKLADGAYVEIIPSATRALVQFCKASEALDRGNIELSEAHDRRYAKEAQILQQHNSAEHEGPDQAQIPGVYYTETRAPR